VLYLPEQIGSICNEKRRCELQFSLRMCNAVARPSSENQLNPRPAGPVNLVDCDDGSCCFVAWTTSSMVVASWNVNSIRARLEHVRSWLTMHSPDVLLLQELKATEFPAELFEELGYASAAVMQKTYNGVAILSRDPIDIVSTTLIGDETDSHARFLEVVVNDVRIANIYAPNGNPVGSDKFLYKLAWMDRLQQQMQIWLKSEMPTLVGGDFNVIPEDIDCHKPASWMHDALFQPGPRVRYRALIGLGYTDAFRSLHPGQGGHFTFWDYFRKAFEYNRGIRIDHFLLSPGLSQRLESCEIDKGPRALDKPSDHTPIVARFHGV
jgi:exodeoxyribonuclease III